MNFSKMIERIRTGWLKLPGNAKRLQIPSGKDVLCEREMKFLGDFACAVAHDFNNVLTSINGFSYLLGEEMNQDYLEQISISARLGKNISANLLTLARRHVRNPREVRLGDIVLNLHPVLNALATDEIELRIEPAADELPVWADSLQMEQAVINLCLNARDAISGNGIITVGTRTYVPEKNDEGKQSSGPSSQFTALYVADTGKGIPAEHLDRIFEPFYTPGRKSRSMGLGLFAVRSIVQDHNGFTRITSKEGHGTLFEIFLPSMGTGSAGKNE